MLVSVWKDKAFYHTLIICCEANTELSTVLSESVFRIVNTIFPKFVYIAGIISTFN